MISRINGGKSLFTFVGVLCLTLSFHMEPGSKDWWLMIIGIVLVTTDWSKE